MAAMTSHISARPGKHRQAPAGDAIIRLYQGNPVTDSLTISREFLRQHKSVLQSLDGLIADGTINRQDFMPVKYTDAKGEQRRMIELTETGALIAMPFIGGKNSRTGQARFVNAFMAMRSELAALYDGGWPELRKKASTSYQMMCDALKEERANRGKETLPRHYIAEAKLINWVLFGYFGSVDRHGVAQPDLDLMDKVEARNGIWIAMGRTYSERKAALPAYLHSLRAKRARIAK